jgi:hypothetical protein
LAQEAAAGFSRQEPAPDGSSSARFVDELPITGASVSVIVGNRQQSTISVSDAIAAKIEELQFVLGEGPHWEALRSGQPVLAPDLRGSNRDDWPMLAGALADFDVGALFAFPLRTGAVTIGVVDLYRSAPGPLNKREVAGAIDLAREVAPRAFQFAITLAKDETPPSTGLAVEMRREVHQATGMILVQLDTTATEAFARLRAHAFASGISIQEVAKDVVQRRLNFRDLPE